MGIAGLVARARGKEALALDPALFGRGGPLGLHERRGAAISGHDGDQVGDLLGLQREELVARLGRLQGTDGGLAFADQGGELGALTIEIADDARLHAQRVLQPADGVFPAGPGIGQKLRLGRGHGDVGVVLLEHLVDLGNIEGDVLRLAQKLTGPVDILL